MENRVALRKKAEQPSVLNSDVSGPITAVLSPVLKVILPILLPVLGWGSLEALAGVAARSDRRLRRPSCRREPRRWLRTAGTGR
jgi:hypothetical protein